MSHENHEYPAYGELEEQLRQARQANDKLRKDWWDEQRFHVAKLESALQEAMAALENAKTSICAARCSERAAGHCVDCEEVEESLTKLKALQEEKGLDRTLPSGV